MDEPGARAIRWTKAIVWTAWGAVILFILASAAGESPVKPARATRVVQLSLIPEGWAFFTRDPREPADVVYRPTNGALARLTFPNTSARNLFGASRSARAFDAELAALLQPVLTSTWAPCGGDPTVCVAQLTARPLQLTNWSTTRYLCGDIVVVRRPPVPWAWSRSRDHIHVDSRVLRLSVGCSPTRPATYR